MFMFGRAFEVHDVKGLIGSSTLSHRRSAVAGLSTCAPRSTRQQKEKSYANALGGPGMHLLHTKVAVFLSTFRLELRDGVGKIEDADLLAPGDGHAWKASLPVAVVCAVPVPPQGGQDAQRD